MSEFLSPIDAAQKVRAALRLPVMRNPIFEKYRKLLGEKLFQEFAEFTKNLAREKYSSSEDWTPGSENLFLYRLPCFSDEEVIMWLVRKVEDPTYGNFKTLSR